jgi:hypothetical protein
MPIDLPADGDTDWGDPAREAITRINTADTPAQRGFIGWTFDPMYHSGPIGVDAEYVHGTRMYLPAGTLTGCAFFVWGDEGGCTTAKFGLVNASTGTVTAVVDILSATTTVGFHYVNFTTPVSWAGGDCYGTVFCLGAPPSMMRAGAGNSRGYQAYAPAESPSTMRSGVVGDDTPYAVYPSSFTLANSSPNARFLWFGIY